MNPLRMKVVDASTGAALSDAVVTLTGGFPEATVVTDGDGACSAEIPDGTALVYVLLERDGYAVVDLALVPLDGMVLYMARQTSAPPDRVLPPEPGIDELMAEQKS